MSQKKNNGQFSFNADSEVKVLEQKGDMTREPWLMLMARAGQTPTKTLCWGVTNAGSAFARIGTQEGDLVNGFVHEDPYKTRLLGPYAYFVDEDDKYFTHCWYPVLHDDQKLETTYGFGYAKSSTEYNGVKVDTCHFVPNGFDGMVQIFTIKNTTGSDKKLKMFNVNPINIGDARDIQFSGFNTLMMGGALIDKDINAVVWRNSYGIPFDDNEDVTKGVFGKVAVHTTSLDNSQFATKYEDFVGHYTNSMANPAALFEAGLPNKEAQENTSALSTIRNEITLKAGEEKEIVVALVAASTEDYYANGKKELKANLAQVKDPKKAWELFEAAKKEWADRLSMLQINIPGEDTLVHSFKWLQYQCEMVAILNRMKSRFHSGFEYGFGFRDILQDVLTLLPYGPEPVRDLLKYISEQMFSDGSVYHNFFVSAPGNKDFVACDDPLWLIYAVCEYIKESGDYSILDDVVPYADEKEGKPAKEGSILDHCKTALKRVWDNSDQGLPFMMHADWNDDLSGYEEHRSIMAAQMLFKAYNNLAELLEVSGKETDLIADYKAKAATVKKSIAEKGMDKKGHYLRAVSPNPAEVPHLGDSEGDGFTFFEPIAWAGFSGVATKEEFDVAMKVCEEDLDDIYGIAICQGDKVMTEGKLPTDWTAWKRNAPGKKENGGEFRHLESWYTASLCGFGYGQKAYDLYMKTLPAIASEKDPYNYAAERFVFPEYVSAPASAEHGRAGHTWLTGTAPTRQGVFMEWILGIRRDYNGLFIDPCVTPQWKEFSALRTFRKTVFNISFSNPNGVEKGVKEIKVDGKAIQGQTIPVEYCDGKSHTVEVLMG